ncbi:MAG: Gldg family protein [Candidatus Njordarchaeia archaeon]
MHRNIKPALLLIFIFVISSAFALHSVRGQEGYTVKILLRESSGQYYTHSLYQTIISDIKSNGGLVDYYDASNTTYYSRFQEYDLIIIPNPGTDFSSDELQALKNYLDNGGSLLIMGDVQYSGNAYGKPDWLNNLLSYIGVSNKVTFWGTNALGDEIYNDVINEANRPWQVKVAAKYFKPHEISIGIKTVVITSSTLDVKDPDVIVATSPEGSYAEDINGNTHAKGKLPWLAALEVGEGKVVVCGSSRMFSDRTLSGSGVPYIKYGDNRQLFFNIVKWTTGFAPKLGEVIDVFVPILDIFGLALGFVVAFLYKLDTKITFIYSVWGAIIYAIIGAVQVALFGVTVLGVGLPQWGYVAGGIVASGGEGISVPAWGVAFMRYFLAGIFEVALGAFIYYLYDRFLKKTSEE